MSIQVSTRIDEKTKQQFDRVCAGIGISPSNALSLFIKGVINYNGIPFDAIAPANEPLQRYQHAKKAVRRPFQYGSMSDEIWMADDFDAPLDDFEEYM